MAKLLSKYWQTEGVGEQDKTEGIGSQTQGARPVDWDKVEDTAANVVGLATDPVMTYLQQKAKKRSIGKRAGILRAVPKAELPGVNYNIRGPQGMTYEQKQGQRANIAGIRSGYNGSDPTMQLLANQMTGAKQLDARNQVAGQDAQMYRQDQSRYDQDVNRFNQQKFQRDSQQAQINNKYNTDRALIDSGEQRELQTVRDETMDYGRSVLDNASRYASTQDAMGIKNRLQLATNDLEFAQQRQLDDQTVDYSKDIKAAREALSALNKENEGKSYFNVRGGFVRGLFKK